MHSKTVAILEPILSGNYKRFLTASHQQLTTKQKIVIDFSSPNIAKPFHFGHLKSTILGNFLANINEFVGNQVVRVNYVGDWGTQYGLLSLGLERFPHDLNTTSISPNQKLRQLLDIYVKANELGKSDETFYAAARQRFRELGESIDSENHKKWRQIRDLSLEELRKSYQILGVTFDEFEFESEYGKDLNNVIDLLERSPISSRSADGMLSAKVKRGDRSFEVPIIKADGASLYITRDIAAAIERKNKYNFDKMLYVVGSDQEKHFHCLGDIIKNLGYHWHDQLVHVKTGKVLGMSSRHGTAILLSDIIEEATKRYIETTKETPTSKVLDDQNELEDVGRNLALSALYVYDMRRKRTKNYDFAWNQVMNITDRSGIHLQTTFARLCSLLRRNKEAGMEPLRSGEEINHDGLSCIEASELLDHMERLSEVVAISFETMNPNHLVNHAFDLCKAINRARQTQNLWVLGESNEEYARSRLTLFKAAHTQLELIIKLLGLRPLERV